MDTKETQESFGLHFFPVITCNRLYWKEDKETIIGLILSTGSPPKNILLAQILAFELRRDSFKPESHCKRFRTLESKLSNVDFRIILRVTLAHFDI